MSNPILRAGHPAFELLLLAHDWANAASALATASAANFGPGRYVALADYTLSLATARADYWAELARAHRQMGRDLFEAFVLLGNDLPEYGQDTAATRRVVAGHAEALTAYGLKLDI